MARMSLVVFFVFFVYSSINQYNLVEWFGCKIWQKKKRSINFLLFAQGLKPESHIAAEVPCTPMSAQLTST